MLCLAWACVHSDSILRKHTSTINAGSSFASTISRYSAAALTACSCHAVELMQRTAVELMQQTRSRLLFSVRGRRDPRQYILSKDLSNISHTLIDGVTNLRRGQPDFLERIGDQPVVQVIGTRVGIFAIGGRGRIGSGTLSLAILLLEHMSLLALRNGSSLVTCTSTGKNRSTSGRSGRSSTRHSLLCLCFGCTNVLIHRRLRLRCTPVYLGAGGGVCLS